MKMFLKNIKAHSYLPYYFGLFGKEKRAETNSLSRTEKIQKIKFFKKRIKDTEYLDHAIDVIAHGLTEKLTKKEKPDLNKLTVVIGFLYPGCDFLLNCFSGKGMTDTFQVTTEKMSWLPVKNFL